MQWAKVSGDCGADGPPRLVQQPSYDCCSAYGEDEELEHCGEPTIWFELVDDQNKCASRQQRGPPQRRTPSDRCLGCCLDVQARDRAAGVSGDGVPPSLCLLQIELSNTNSVAPAIKGIARSFCGGFGGSELARREGEDWSMAKEYVRSLPHRMA